VSRDEVSVFVKGNVAAVEEVRSAIEDVVRRFRLPPGGWNRELVQEALGRVFISVARGRFRGESSLKTYAQQVAKYTCLEHLRRRRAESAINGHRLSARALWPDPEEQMLRDEQHRINLRAFAGMSRECRELFCMIFVERLSYREVAQRLGVSEGAVRLRVHRCRLTGRRTIHKMFRGPRDLGRPATSRPADVGGEHES
jgi:RNA polymerase sigma-70 factor (ECF subfamily)